MVSSPYLGMSGFGSIALSYCYLGLMCLQLIGYSVFRLFTCSDVYWLLLVSLYSAYFYTHLHTLTRA